MINKLKSLLFIPKKTPEELEKDRIVYSIDAVLAQLRESQERFNTTLDETLIESIIFEMASLEAKYKHLLELAKSKGITVNAKRSILIPCIINIDSSIT